jgi:hypothetical protein
MGYFTFEQALVDKEFMYSLNDKSLFIILYGNLISDSFKKRVENKESIDDIFKDLCKQLQEAQL